MQVETRFLDTISRPPGMAGEANDAVSAYTQPDYCECQRRSVLRCGKDYHPVEDPHTGTIEEPVVHIERNLYGHP